MSNVYYNKLKIQGIGSLTYYLPVIWCLCGGSYGHVHASRQGISAPTNPGSIKIQTESKHVHALHPSMTKICLWGGGIFTCLYCVLPAPQGTALLSESWSSWIGLLPHSNPLRCTDIHTLENTKTHTKISLTPVYVLHCATGHTSTVIRSPWPDRC